MNKLFTRFLPVCLFLISLFVAIPKAEAQRICLSHEHEMEMRQKYPQLGSVEDFERELQLVSESLKGKRQRMDVIQIPIIIHLIHDGETVGTGDNISADLVYAQIDQMNADFRKEFGTSGHNDHPDGADTFIEFAPALIDPSGNLMSEPGINRINRNDMGWTAPPYDGIGSNYIDDTIKPASSWDPDNYFNFWAMDLSGGLLGYAQFPSMSTLQGLNDDEGPASTDGVVVLTSSMGSSAMPNPAGGSFDEGRTATHEVGHWLGLRHIWGDTGCGGDDFVTDTPLQGFSSSGCPTGQDSCTDDALPDMVENYMDYSDDACMNIFTTGQKARMDAVMSISPRRASLLNSTVHLAPYPNLIISEVMDGDESGGVPKYVEIHNAGDDTYDLSTVSIRVYANGSATVGNTVSITGGTMLGAGESYVVAGAAFDIAWGGIFATETPDQIDGGISGNGDDVYELYDSDTELAIDVFGAIGTDGTGEPWEYVDGSMVRNSYILRGNAGNFDIADWGFLAYSNSNATPGSHTAETPAYDPTLDGITGIDEGALYIECDGSIAFNSSVWVRNSGTGDISDVEIEVTYPGIGPERMFSETILATFSPALSPGDVGEVTLTEFNISDDGNYTLSVDITDVRDGNPTNNETADVSFEVNIFEDAHTVTVETQTDGDAGETSWDIATLEGTVIYEKLTFADNDLDQEVVCLEDGTYVFTLYDSWGDGILNGGYSSINVGGEVVTIIPGDHPDLENGSASVQFSLPFVASPDASVNITSPLAGSLDNCVFDVPLIADITNEGNTVITSIDVSYGLTGSTQTTTIDGLSMVPGDVLEYDFGVHTLVTGSNDLEVNIISVNGSPDDNSSNDNSNVNVNFTLGDGTEITVTLTTDPFPEEISWEILDDQGVLVVESATDLPESDIVVDVFCLADGDYTFNIYDTASDGIFNGGGVIIEDDLDQEVANIPGASYDGVATVNFTLPFVPFNDLAISITDPLEGDAIESCQSLQEVTVLVENIGSTLITDVVLDLNGDEYSFNDIEFPVGAFSEFVLGEVDLTAGANTITASITSVNGGADDDNTNDVSSVNVTYTLDEESTTVQLDFHLDGNPGELTWTVYDGDGTAVATGSGGDYGVSDATVTEYICLDDGCYTILLEDSWGDGGTGVDVIVDGVTEFSHDGVFGASVEGLFCVGDALRPVTDFIAAGSGPFSIDLSWTYGSDEDGFDVLRSSTGDAGSYSLLAELDPTARSYSDDNGLEPSTEYHYAIVANRGDEQSFASYASGVTLVNIPSPALHEGFENGFLPTNWSSIDNDGDTNDWFEYDNAVVGSDVSFLGEKCAASASWTGGSALTPDNYLITPQITMGADFVLSYAIGAQDPNFPAEKYSVLISTTGTAVADFTDELVTEVLSDGNWHVNQFDLSSYSGQNIYIAFRHWDVTDEFYIKLDEVIVGSPGTGTGSGVTSPDNLVATAVSPFQIDLAWTHEGADEFVILRALTDELGAYEVVEIIPGTNTSYSDNGLDPETTYYYEVRAVVGEDTSVGATASATTDASMGGNFTLDESFEGQTFPPTGWMIVDEDGDTFNWYLGVDPQHTASDGVQSAVSGSYDNGTSTALTPDNYMITPAVAVASGDFLIYYVAAQDPNWTAEKYQVLVSTTGTAIADFTNEITTETLTSAEWAKREFSMESFAGQTVYIAFRHFDVTDQFEMKIDNVKLGDPSAGDLPPAGPSNLAAVANGTDAIDLTWDDNADNEDGFDLQSADTDIGPWTDVTATLAADAAAHSVTGLTEGTTMYYRVRANNAFGLSEWSNISGASTSLVAPTNLTATANGTSQIDLTWTDNSSAEDGYAVETSSNGSDPWTVLDGGLAADAASFSHTGLTAGTTAHYRVKAVSASSESDWSNSASASTVVLGAGSLGDVMVQMYPNPVSDILNIDLSRNKDVKVSIIDFAGKSQEAQLSRFGNSIQLNMNGLSDGIYIVNLSDGVNEVNWRIVKK